MQIELTKEVVATLLESTEPSYALIDLIPKDLGYYCGGFMDRWIWTINKSYNKYTTEQLYELYLLCKKENSKFQEKINSNLNL